MLVKLTPGGTPWKFCPTLEKSLRTPMFKHSIKKESNLKKVENRCS